MSDFQTMKARVASEIKRGDYTACATSIQNAVLDSIKFYETRRFPWNEFVDSSHITVASSPVVTITSSLRIVSIDNIKLTIGSRFYPLGRTTYRNIDSIDSTQWAGYPEYWTWFNAVIRLYPIPNEAYKMHISGVKKLEEISSGAAGAATNEWMVEGEEMIRLRAKGLIFRDEVRNEKQAGIMFSQADDFYRSINKETWGKLRSGVVQATKL